MSVRIRESEPAARRVSVYVDGYAHTNPIPAACRVDNVVYSSIIHGVDRSRPDADAGADRGAGLEAGANPQSLEEQAELMFARLVQVVEASGATLDDVVKVTMWMRDRADREAINHLWTELFPDPSARPARQTVNAQLDGDQLIQCDFVAVIEQNERGVRRS